jgi:hypothetical protein
MATASPKIPYPQIALRTVPASDRHCWYEENTRVDEIVRLEQLVPDMRRVLARKELAVREGALDRLEHSQVRNRSKHADPLTYYDDEALALVRDRDHLIWELFYS